ncbi:hypothetical protein FQZ97_1207610 [compost metagenome]
MRARRSTGVSSARPPSRSSQSWLLQRKPQSGSVVYLSTSCGSRLSQSKDVRLGRNARLNEPKERNSISALRPSGPWRQRSKRAMGSALRYSATGW